MTAPRAWQAAGRLTAALHHSVAPEAASLPDVVLIRTAARGVMTVGDAVPDLVIEGKPQCHIVALAEEQHRPVASVAVLS
jgi:hypothetical protein